MEKDGSCKGAPILVSVIIIQIRFRSSSLRKTEQIKPVIVFIMEFDVFMKIVLWYQGSCQ